MAMVACRVPSGGAVSDRPRRIRVLAGTDEPSARSAAVCETAGWIMASRKAGPVMRYLVTARIKKGQRDALRRAIDDGSLGSGSIAGDEYQYDMAHARELTDGQVKWVETCFCPTPLQE